MDYTVASRVEPPGPGQELDALHREGVSAVLDRQLARVDGVTGPDEVEIDVLDYGVTVGAQGARVLLALDAPSMRAAEDAAATVLAELLSDTEALAEWSVSSSEAHITEDDFNRRLAEAEELELAGAETVQEIDEETSSLDTHHWREKLFAISERFRAFGMETFGAPTSETAEDSEAATRARMAAGALIHAVRVVTDELFYDEMSLSTGGETVADVPGLLVLDELPPRYAQNYDVVFARAFLISSVTVGARLTEPEWTAPRCVAEALALQLFITEARVILEAAGVVSWAESTGLFAEFTERAGAGGYEALYQVESGSQLEADLAAQGLAWHQWFRPFPTPTGTPGRHPYLDAAEDVEE